MFSNTHTRDNHCSIRFAHHPSNAFPFHSFFELWVFSPLVRWLLGGVGLGGGTYSGLPPRSCPRHGLDGQVGGLGVDKGQKDKAPRHAREGVHLQRHLVELSKMRKDGVDLFRCHAAVEVAHIGVLRVRGPAVGGLQPHTTPPRHRRIPTTTTTPPPLQWWWWWVLVVVPPVVTTVVTRAPPAATAEAEAAV